METGVLIVFAACVITGTVVGHMVTKFIVQPILDREYLRE